MNEVLADVSALTGDRNYLALARRFSHEALLAPLAESRDPLDGLHANTQIPKAVGFQRVYELTGDERYGSAARFFWRTIVDHRSFVTGGHGDNEHFFPPVRVREASAVGQDDGDVRDAQHAAPDADGVSGHAARRDRRFLRARSLQRHPRVAGSGERDDDVFPGHATRIRPPLSHARAVVLVLHRHRHGEPREVRRLDLLHERRRNLGQPLHRVGRDVEARRA